MTRSRISPQDIINFGALCLVSLFLLCLFFCAKTLKNSLEITQRENYITKAFEGISYVLFFFDAQQKDDDAYCTAHMLFLRIGCRHLPKEGANRICVCS